MNKKLTLTGNSIRYLGIHVRVNTINSYNANTNFRIKIFDPNGNLLRGSPQGYTYARSVRINNTGIYNLGGWGSASGGSYSRGSWRVEIWYATPTNQNTNELIATRTFRFE